jgi:hypothetical protein
MVTKLFLSCVKVSAITSAPAEGSFCLRRSAFSAWRDFSFKNSGFSLAKRAAFAAFETKRFAH